MHVRRCGGSTDRIMLVMPVFMSLVALPIIGLVCITSRDSEVKTKGVLYLVTGIVIWGIILVATN